MTFFNRYAGLSAGCIGFFGKINIVSERRKNFRLIRAANTGTLLNALSAALCRNHYLPFAVGVRELVGKLCLFSVTKGAFCILNAVGCAGCRNGSYCAGIGVIPCRNVCNLCAAGCALDFSAGGAVKNNLACLMSGCRDIFSSAVSAAVSLAGDCLYTNGCAGCRGGYRFFKVMAELCNCLCVCFVAIAANGADIDNLSVGRAGSRSNLCFKAVRNALLADCYGVAAATGSNGNNAVCVAGRLSGNSCTCKVFNVFADINGFNSAASIAGQSENTCCAVIAFAPGVLV